MPIPKFVIVGALMAAQVVMGSLRKIEGPRLESLDITVADYGTPIPRFWGKRKFETPIIWAEKLREEKHTSKTKGGKFSEYKYFASFAVVIADHEIDGIRRIWFDRHLVFQLGDVGPVSVGGIASTILTRIGGRVLKLSQGKHMRFYLGTETQGPDPRMEEWCEDRYGPDSCPAYRGVSYIVFEEIPVEKFGNRIPQVTVEAIYTKTDSFPYETKATTKAMVGAQFSPDFNRLVLQDGVGTEVWDVPTRTKLTDFVSESVYAVGVEPGGFIWGVSGFPAQDLLRIGPDGGETIVTSTFDGFGWGCAYVGELVCVYPYSLISPQALYYDGEKVAYISPGFIASHYFPDEDDQVWACGGLEAGNGARFCTMPDGGSATTATTGETGPVYAIDNYAGEFLIQQANKLFLIDKVSFAVTAGPVAVSSVTEDWLPFRNYPLGAPSLWIGATEYSTADLSVIQTIDYDDWIIEAVNDSIYDPISHALITGSPTGLTWRYLDRIDNAGTELEDIVTDVAGWCGLTGIDATDLDQIVLGYSVTQGSGKDMIAPLLDIHDSDARPHDFDVQFLKRGDAPTGTLLTPDFVREGDEARYVVQIAQDTDITRKLTVTFADDGKDQQANTVIALRPLDAVDSVREQTIDLATYNGTPGEMQKLADRYFRRQWFGRETIQLALTAQSLALEPADVKTVSLDGETRIARCTKVTLSAGALKTEWERDDPVVNEFGTGAGADMEGRDPEIIFIPSPTKGFVLDIPLVQDADESVNPQLYYAAGNYGIGNWPGAVIWEGDPDGETYNDDWNAVDAASGATWGYATDALPTANPNLWDRGNSVNIKSYGGDLTSVTEAEIDADPSLNLAYLGGELLNFTTAFLEADDTYTLSGFKRGRRGTEWAVGLHAIQDEFVLAADLENEGVGVSEIGDTLHYKAQSFGRDPSTAPAIDITFAGNSLKPYAPAVQSVTKDSASGDIVVDFDRRTRIGGNWNGSVIPLGEATEAYELDVLDGSDVARTLTATTTSFIYLEDDQTTDFGAPIAANDLDAMLYQLSATVGRGFAATV